MMIFSRIGIRKAGSDHSPDTAGNDSSSSGTATPQEVHESTAASPDTRGGHHYNGHPKPMDDAGCNGTHMAWLSGREKAEELIMIAFRWLATVDQFMCLRSRGAKGRPGPFTLQKVQNLLAGAPLLLLLRKSVKL